MKPISKSKGSGAICIVQLMDMDILWIFNFLEHVIIKRIVKAFEEPLVLTKDKALALLCAFKKMQKNGLYTYTIHCTLKHLNNLIEQDHRHVKRRFAKSSGFQSIRHASRTIKGIETIQAIYKQRRSLASYSSFSAYKELQKLVEVA